MIISKTKSFLLFLLLSHHSLSSYSQKSDSTKANYFFNGDIGITNNGISIVPAFSLGKPAVVVSLAMGKNKLSFEPQFFFSMEGKPWSYLLWMRYKLKDTGKFRTRIGVHLALPFNEVPVTANNITYNVLQTHRFGVVEVAPYYLLSKNITVGVYYLYSHGFDEGSLKNNHYLSLNGSLSNIKLDKQISIRISPQFYYLKLDKNDGLYFFSTLVFSKKNSPFSVSFLMNKKLKTNIKVGKDFDWNATLSYSFNHNFVKK